MSQADDSDNLPPSKKPKTEEEMKVPFLFRIRTVTAFLSLQPNDFPTAPDGLEASKISSKVSAASKVLKTMEKELTDAGYEVQTLRVVTNPFGQWMTNPHNSEIEATRLDCWNKLLDQHKITFCAVGAASGVSGIEQCLDILKSSPYLSCSAHVASGDVEAAKAAARCIQQVAALPGKKGLGNFNFCMSNVKPNIPFFPAAKAASECDNDNGLVGFALGLENGKLAQDLLQKTKSIANINTTFRDGMAQALTPTQELCQKIATQNAWTYLGIDTSLNPSLDEGGSVAEAMEFLDEIDTFGGPGTIGAAAAVTTALQSLPGITRTGYCGLMLPVCEDQRLAALACAQGRERLEVPDLLCISSVCGVGIDTVPLAGDVSTARLTSLLLDVAGLAERWNKSLSCRVLPFEGKKEGQRTDFDSPYMVNSEVFSL